MDSTYVKTTEVGLVFTKLFFQFCLRKQLNDPTLMIHEAEYAPSASEKMALALKHPKSGSHPIGVQRYNLLFESQGKQQQIVVIVKSKISEEDYLKAISTAFFQCGIRTTHPVYDYLSQLEFAYVNRKEAAIYAMQQAYPAFQQYLPFSYGSYVSGSGDACVLVLQYLDEEWLSLDPFNIAKWNQRAIENLCAALAKMHAVWYQKEAELMKIPGFGNRLDAVKMQQLMPYWLALADAVKLAQLPFLQVEDYAFHSRLIQDIPIWRAQIDTMKKTLVQNDCVPKNVAFSENERQIYVYDWEIATIHLPQRDAVEFLSYVLPTDFDAKLLLHYLDQHRLQLAEATKTRIAEEEWQLGFKYCLYDFLIQRVLPQLVFEKLEARNIANVYANVRKMITLLS